MERSDSQPAGPEAGDDPGAGDQPVDGPEADVETGLETGVAATTGTTDAEPEDAPEPAPTKKRQRYEWLILVVISLAVALVVRAFLIQAFYIPSESMYPTLKTNDRVLVNKLAYRLSDVERGDIVVFHAPVGAATNGIKDLIKRVVGLPGESIEGRDGIVYIDGKPLDEPYLQPEVRSTTFGPEKVPQGEYFMMGDNRQGSRDSTKFGPIDEGTIVGRAFVKIWPLSDLGLL